MAAALARFVQGSDRSTLADDAAYTVAWLCGLPADNALEAVAFSAGLVELMRRWFKQGRPRDLYARGAVGAFGATASDDPPALHPVDSTALASVYRAVLRRRAGISLSSELFFCIELLFADHDGGGGAGQREVAGAGAGDASAGTRFAHLFASAGDCACVAALTLPAFSDLLRAMGRGMLQALADCNRLATHAPDFARTLRGWMDSAEADFDDGKTDGRAAPFYYGQPVASESEDNRSMHETRALQDVYNCRQRARDGFYALLREWTSANKSQQSRATSAFLTGGVDERVRSLLGEMGPSNMLWFAGIFVGALVRAAGASTVPSQQSAPSPQPAAGTDAGFLSTVDGKRLQQLNARMGGRNTTGTADGRREPCDAAGFAIGAGDIFTRFLLATDSHSLCRHVMAASLACIASIETAMAAQAERSAATEFADSALGLRALGRIIGLLTCFVPVGGRVVVADGTVAQFVSAVDRLVPAVPIATVLRQALDRGILALALLWIVEYAGTTSRDPIFAKTRAHSHTLSALCAAYRSVVPGTPADCARDICRPRMLAIATLETLFDSLSISPWAYGLADSVSDADDADCFVRPAADACLLNGCPDSAVSPGTLFACALLLYKASVRAQLGFRKSADRDGARGRQSISRKVALTRAVGPTALEEMQRWFLWGNKDAESVVDFVANGTARRIAQRVTVTNPDDLAGARREAGALRAEYSLAEDEPDARTPTNRTTLSRRQRASERLVALVLQECDCADADVDAAVRAMLRGTSAEVAGIAAGVARERMRSVASALVQARATDNTEPSADPARKSLRTYGASTHPSLSAADVTDDIERLVAMVCGSDGAHIDAVLVADAAVKASSALCAAVGDEGFIGHSVARRRQWMRVCPAAARAAVAIASRCDEPVEEHQPSPSPLPANSNGHAVAVRALLDALAAAADAGLRVSVPWASHAREMCRTLNTVRAANVAVAMHSLAVAGLTSRRDVERAVIAICSSSDAFGALAPAMRSLVASSAGPMRRVGWQMEGLVMTRDP